MPVYTAAGGRLHDELRRLSHADEQAVVIVTHSPALAALADRTLRLDGGRLVPA